MTGPGPARFPWRKYAWVLLAILILALWPLISVYLTYLIAEANGCLVNEASVNPCIVLGVDLGGLLYGMGVMGWFMLATIPLGGGALIVWVVMLIIHYLAWWQKQQPESP